MTKSTSWLGKNLKGVIDKFGMQHSNPSRTPAENNLKQVKAIESETSVDEIMCRSLVGSLLYIAKQTRPDIVWIVNVLSRFKNQPTNTLWLAGKRVLRYLQATKPRTSLASVRKVASLILRSWVPGLGSSRTRGNLLAIHPLRDGVSAFTDITHWWRQRKLHQTDKQPCDAQAIKAYRYNVSFSS